MTTQTFSPSRPPSELTLKAEALLVRYPKLDERDLHKLIDIFPRLRVLDVGMMTADDLLAEKLEAFQKDHGSKLKVPMASVLGFLAFPILVMLTVLWWVLSPSGV